jgi:Bacterial RNA polymerase, alpha chain C terminal domain
MSKSFTFMTHEADCTPAHPCRPCVLASMFRDHISEATLIRLHSAFEHVADIRKHKDGCRPLKPCGLCESMRILRKGLPKAKYDKCVAIMTGTESARKPLKSPREAELAKGLDTPVTELTLSVRTRALLQKRKVATVRDLVQYSSSDLLSKWKSGNRTVNELKEVLHGMGLYLKGTG